VGEQLVGAGTVLVLVLGYVILVQVLAACIVLLGQFTIIQWRSLRTLLVQEPPRTLPSLAAWEVHQTRGELEPTIQIGGGLKRWQ
jgi:hypothetical protein